MTNLNKFSTIVVATMLFSAISCNKVDENVSPSQAKVETNTIPAVDETPQSHVSSSENPNLRSTNNIGGGLAFGIPLSNGVNLRLVNISNVSSVQRVGEILQDWWPNPRATFSRDYSNTVRYATQSQVTYGSSLGVSASALKGLVTANVNANASKTASKEIATTLSINITVPPLKQFRWQILEKRIGWVGTLYKITVIGNPTIASTSNGTMKIETTTVRGDYPVEFIQDRVFR